MNPKTTTIIITALLASFVGSALAYLFLPLRPSQPEPTVYSKVQQRGTIRAGYAVGAPLFSIDPNTKDKSGTFYEIVEQAAKRLNLTVSWTDEVGYGEMIQGLDSHRYDIVGSGVWVQAAPARARCFVS